VSAPIDELRRIVGADHVVTDPVAIGRGLRDNSWLSPLIEAELGARVRGADTDHGVEALVSPGSEEEIFGVLDLAVAHGVAVTPRGAGTSNFGQAQPSDGGIVLDTRRLRGVTTRADDRITALAGTVQGDVEAAARSAGRELSLLTTTFATATIAGWVAGGHVGLGTSMYGTIWDGNVLGARIATATGSSSALTLDEQSVTPVLHAFGTTGVILDVTMPLVPARRWGDWVATFPTFERSCEFVEEAARRGVPNRVAAAQDTAIMPSFRALRPLGLDPTRAGVLIIADEEDVTVWRDLADSFEGDLHRWRLPDQEDRPGLQAMVYGHRLLWVKRSFPAAAFLHVYFHPDRLHEQIAAVKERFGERVLIELKFMASPWLSALQGAPTDRPLPAAVLTLVDGTRAELDTVIDACRELGIGYQDPHTAVLEESGLFPDPQGLVEFARRVDPTAILNPGKLGARRADRQVA
jgi:FAD/FMN-containing dehydrogenase